MKKKVKSRKKKSGYALLLDLVILAIGILATVVLAKLGIIDALVYSLRDYTALASFIAGIFFTSTFTLAPSSVALVEIAEHAPTPVVAIWGALGAACGDLILFYFIRDRFSEDIKNVIHPKKMYHFIHSFHFGFLKWCAPLLGGLIIASPLPDEFAVSLMGLSRIKTTVLLPVSFLGNILGIYLLVAFAHLIS